jgi:hypothetical protein
MSGFSLLGLPGGALLDEGRAVWLGWLTLGLAGFGLVHSLVLLWTEGDAGFKLLIAVVAFAGACAQASGTTARLRNDDSQAVSALYLAGIAGALLLAGMISFAAWQEVEDAGYYRFLGALAVAVLLATILQPIVRRTGKREEAAVAFEIVCTTADGRRTPKRVEADDFAAAAASAIRDLERRGARVVRVERA